MSKHLLSLALACACVGAFAADEKGEKDDGEAVKLESLPAPVQTAIKAAVGTATIKELEKETKDGKVVYEAEFVGADGKTHEVAFDEAGKPVVEKAEAKGEEKQ